MNAINQQRTQRTQSTLSTAAGDEHPLMTALGRGFPITLLVDLIDPNGPRSLEMLDRERVSRPRAAAGSRMERSTAARTA